MARCRTSQARASNPVTREATHPGVAVLSTAELSSLSKLSKGSAVAGVNYQIPDELHRRVKAAAARQGVTLKEFLIDALEQAARAAERKERR